MVHYRSARGGEAEGGAGLAPAAVGAVGGADARTHAGWEPRRVHGGGHDDTHVPERRGRHRGGRADEVADLAEREVRAHRDHAERPVGGEAQGRRASTPPPSPLSLSSSSPPRSPGWRCAAIRPHTRRSPTTAEPREGTIMTRSLRTPAQQPGPPDRRRGPCCGWDWRRAVSSPLRCWRTWSWSGRSRPHGAAVRPTTCRRGVHVPGDLLASHGSGGHGGLAGDPPGDGPPTGVGRTGRDHPVRARPDRRIGPAQRAGVRPDPGPCWLGLLGLLPSAVGVVAVVQLWRGRP